VVTQKKRKKSRWLISEKLWKEIEPLLPKPRYNQNANGGRPRVDDKKVLEAILFVLKTGCQWKALDVTGIPIKRPKPKNTKPQNLCLDKAYDAEWVKK
jgi:transposase